MKKLLIGAGRKQRYIPFGLYRGLKLSIDPASESAFYFGIYERETTSWLRNRATVAKSLIDVGSGSGELTVWGLAHANMQRVIAYDSAVERRPRFLENVEANGFDRDDRLTSIARPFLSDDDHDGDIQRIKALPEPILLKIDVDGGERVILGKMRDILRQKRFFILVETHSRDLDNECFQLLGEANYRVRRITPAWWRVLIPEQRPIEFNQWIVAE